MLITLFADSKAKKMLLFAVKGKLSDAKIFCVYTIELLHI